LEIPTNSKGKLGLDGDVPTMPGSERAKLNQNDDEEEEEHKINWEKVDLGWNGLGRSEEDCRSKTLDLSRIKRD
jgi:hypothetical protein